MGAVRTAGREESSTNGSQDHRASPELRRSPLLESECAENILTRRPQDAIFFSNRLKKKGSRCRRQHAILALLFVTGLSTAHSASVSLPHFLSSEASMNSVSLKNADTTSAGHVSQRHVAGFVCRGPPGPAPSKICSGLVAKLGFGCKDYVARTQDGFTLGLQRILPPTPAGHDVIFSTSGKPPVLLQHGLLVGAESWLMSEPQDTSLPLQLARAGFDVWLSNTRCEPWAASDEEELVETSILRNKADWDWSWDDLAQYDVPALVDRVLEVSGSSSVSYVGHSQGTLILLSSLTMGFLPPSKIRAAYLLAPVAFLSHLSSKFARRAASIDFDKLVAETGLHRFSFHNELGQRLVGLVCSDPDINCSSLVTAITGPNCCVDLTRSRKFLPWLPLSTSVKNMGHFAQAVRSGTWRMYDYGWMNLWKYGTLAPPPYSPADMPRVPLALAYGGLDGLAAAEDVEHLLSLLPFSPHVLWLPRYGHLDFILGDTRADNNTVYADVLQFLEKTVEVPKNNG